jgi:hypothetical protein
LFTERSVIEIEDRESIPPELVALISAVEGGQFIGTITLTRVLDYHQLGHTTYEVQLQNELGHKTTVYILGSEDEEEVDLDEVYSSTGTYYFQYSETVSREMWKIPSANGED